MFPRLWNGLGLPICEIAATDSLNERERQLVQFAKAMVQIWEKPDQGERYLFLIEPESRFPPI